MTPPRHDLTTVTVPLNTLRPHPRNPRNGDTDRIAESLDVNGQYAPIVVARDGTVLVGNHRYAAVSGDLPVRSGETVDFTVPRATVAG